MRDIQYQALEYVRNTAGCATVAHFYEDHSPIGRILWDELIALEVVEESPSGNIVLTDKGKLELLK